MTSIFNRLKNIQVVGLIRQSEANKMSTETRINRAFVGDNEVRREEVDNGEYLVAPSNLIRENVYSYPSEDGVENEYLPSEAIEESTDDWEGKPIFLDHPTDSDGVSTSRSNGSINDSPVGEIRSPETDDDTLQAEAWIDLTKLDEYDGELKSVVNALDRGQTLETSAGYDTGVIELSGWHDNHSYQGIQSSISPDHVAMFSPMSQKTGGCSVGDGCGIGRANECTCNTEMSTEFTEAQKEEIESLRNEIDSLKEQVEDSEDDDGDGDEGDDESRANVNYSMARGYDRSDIDDDADRISSIRTGNDRFEEAE